MKSSEKFVRQCKGKIDKFYPYSGTNVTLTMQPSQMTIEEFYKNDHEGIEYSVDGNGNVSVPDGQLSIEDETEA
ncbi:hypothetical protein ACFFHH_12610 [Cytobacillus solani]|uniref:hypothetical protein n=1 Tax=Cytobacillus solani TaxID=1637975 RepID=UPI00070054FC|nr:hypothetical protein [Cytobacillus solani]USK57171.1 hypothetical protein LIS82_12180 [Cytobacillus solani]